MREPRVWQVAKARLTYSGVPHPPDIIGIFTSPDNAFAAVGRHPLFEGAEFEWEAFQYGDPPGTCYAAQAHLMGRRGRRVPYRIFIQPFTLDALRTDWSEDLHDLMAELAEYGDSGPDQGFHPATVMLSSLLEMLPEGERETELYIDCGKESEEETKRLFDTLSAHREEIETSFGDALEWDWIEGRRGCRIRRTIEAGGYRDEERWPEIHDQMIDAMVRLERAIRPHLATIRL